MVQSAEDRVRYNPTVARSTMPRFAWLDRKIDWWIWDAWPQAAVGATLIVMRDPVFCNEA